nr:peptide,conditioned avoidance response [Sus scrofa domesticus]
CYFQNCPK